MNWIIQRILILVIYFGVWSINAVVGQSIPVVFDSKKTIFVQDRDDSDGLSTNMVTSLAVDDAGLVWVGTLDGLNTYDGHIFREVGHFNSVQSANNTYYQIWTGQNQDLYAQRNNGIFQYHQFDKTWTQVLADKAVKGMVMDTASHMIVCNERWELAYLEDASFKENNTRNISPAKDRIQVLQRSDSNGYLALNSEHFVQYTKDFNILKTIDAASLDVSFVGMVETSNTVWIITKKTLIQYDLNDASIQSFDFSKTLVDNNLRHIFIAENRLYISAEKSGLFVKDIAANNWKQVTVKLFDAPQSEPVTLTLFLLHKGDQLFGTNSNGLLYRTKNGSAFYEVPDLSLVDGMVYDMKLPTKIKKDNQGNIWIATSKNGLWQYKLKTKKIDHHFYKNGHEFLKTNYINQLEVHGHKLWIGYSYGRVDVLDTRTLRIVDSYVLRSSKSDKRAVILDMLFDQYNNLWVGTKENGVYVFREGKIYNLNARNSGLTEDHILNIEMVNNQVVLCSSGGTIFIGDSEELNIQQQKTDIDDVDFTLKAIKSDKSGNIWVGTAGQGVVVLNDKWKAFDTLNIQNGDLHNDEICTFLEDQYGKMWVGTNKGLVRFAADTLRKEAIFFQEDGLLSNEFMTGAYHGDGSDKLWMGTIFGVNYWEPSSFERDTILEPIFIRSMQADDKLFENIYHGQDLPVFHRKSNSIRIEFDQLGLNRKPNVHYRTRLNGQDPNWRVTSSQNVLNYINLSGGDYTLQIQRQRSNGDWEDKIYAWKLKVDYKFYEYWWFLVGLVLVSGALLFYFLYLYTQYYNYLREKQMKRERELIKMEMQVLRAQINPHFLFNTLSSINHFILNNEKKVASEYLVDFSKLIRHILLFNKERYITVAKELEILELYIDLEVKRLGVSFDYYITNESDVQLEKIFIPPLILQPIVENAIWHGLMPKNGEKILEINVLNHSNESLKIEVKDNGIGRVAASQRKKESKHKSVGIEITEERLQLWSTDMKQGENQLVVHDLYDENNNATGTSVEIIIPIKNKIKSKQNNDTNSNS